MSDVSPWPHRLPQEGHGVLHSGYLGCQVERLNLCFLGSFDDGFPNLPRERLLCVSGCYTLNTTGSEFGYGPGRKVSETRHTVLGRHAETGLPTQTGLGSGQPILRHQEVPGPSTGADRESASAAAEEDNLGGHHKDKQSEGDGNARSCESRSRNRSGVVSRGTAPRGTTPRVGNRSIVADGQRPEAIPFHPMVRRHDG